MPFHFVATGIGAAESLLAMTIEALSGKSSVVGAPLAELQSMQLRIAESAAEIDCARLLIQRAAWMKDQKRQTTRESAMAKLYASEIAVKVCEEAIQIHGGYGYTKDYPPEKYWRDAKICTIGEGTSEVQRLVIARHLLSGE